MKRSRVLTILMALTLGALVFVACASSDTVDQASTSLPDPDGPTEATTDTAELDNSSAELAFSSDVQPVLEENCVSCHSDNGPGTTHLEMATAADVASIAEFIAFRVDEREMPPWPISPLGEVAFEYDLSMSDSDRQIIVDWAAAGAELDVDGTTELAATNETYSPIDADVVLTAAEPYPGSDALDDYRCQVYDPEIANSEWLTGIDVRPDETRVLHHALIFLASLEQRAVADEMDGADGQPGWACQTIPRLGTDELTRLGGWAPGSNGVVAPDDAGWKLTTGDFLVVQWHYHYDDEAHPDNSGVGLQFASAEQVAQAGGSLRQVETRTLLGPVEIPCATYESGPLCDRDLAVARIGQEFGIQSTLIPEFVNNRCGVSPDDFAHMVDGTASSTCEFNAPQGEVVFIWPHMHELGSTYRMTLNPGMADERILVDIDRWNFDWQMNYKPVETLTFEPGDRLRVDCGWDRALWPAGLEPRYIVWAEGTQDEMCFTGLSLVR